MVLKEKRNQRDNDLHMLQKIITLILSNHNLIANTYVLLELSPVSILSPLALMPYISVPEFIMKSHT